MVLKVLRVPLLKTYGTAFACAAQRIASRRFFADSFDNFFDPRILGPVVRAFMFSPNALDPEAMTVLESPSHPLGS